MADPVMDGASACSFLGSTVDSGGDSDVVYYATLCISAGGSLDARQKRALLFALDRCWMRHWKGAEAGCCETETESKRSDDMTLTW